MSGSNYVPRTYHCTSTDIGTVAGSGSGAVAGAVSESSRQRRRSVEVVELSPTTTDY